ncbi:hypothetical protein [Spiroplasma endosymbiont of Othius punctulatus]|uniref:hypothetical protein n=1 Tax=Spiroplasma endosymbiont of Othius punctulatus TaxID=3066289 RepID=UPI0030CA648D
MGTHKITFRKLVESDKKNLSGLFGKSSKADTSAYAIFELDQLSEDDLFKRMANLNVEVITRDDSLFLGIIEMVPYENNGLELRTVVIQDDNIDPKESEIATEKYIIKALKKHGATRIIISIEKTQDATINHLLSSGYKVVSTINNIITFEFDFGKFNK